MDDCIFSLLLGRINFHSSCGLGDNLFIFLFAPVEGDLNIQLIPWAIAFFFISVLSACFIASCLGKLLKKWSSPWIISPNSFHKVALNIWLSWFSLLIYNAFSILDLKFRDTYLTCYSLMMLPSIREWKLESRPFSVHVKVGDCRKSPLILD